jgi:hypothetical protein
MTGVKTLNPPCAIQKHYQVECLTSLAIFLKQRSLDFRHNVVNTHKRVLKKISRSRHVLKKKKTAEQTDCLKTTIKPHDITLPLLASNLPESLMLLNEIKTPSHSCTVNDGTFSNFSIIPPHTKCFPYRLHILSPAWKKEDSKGK